MLTVSSIIMKVIYRSLVDIVVGLNMSNKSDQEFPNIYRPYFQTLTERIAFWISRPSSATPRLFRCRRGTALSSLDLVLNISLFGRSLYKNLSVFVKRTFGSFPRWWYRMSLVSFTLSWSWIPPRGRSLYITTFHPLSRRMWEVSMRLWAVSFGFSLRRLLLPVWMTMISFSSIHYGGSG